jgi:hypothetical protein
MLLAMPPHALPVQLGMPPSRLQNERQLNMFVVGPRHVEPRTQSVDGPQVWPFVAEPMGMHAGPLVVR